MPNVAVNMRDSQWLLEYFREENVKVRDVLFGVIEALPSAGATAQKLVVFSTLTPVSDQGSRTTRAGRHPVVPHVGEKMTLMSHNSQVPPPYDAQIMSSISSVDGAQNNTHE